MKGDLDSDSQSEAGGQVDVAQGGMGLLQRYFSKILNRASPPNATPPHTRVPGGARPAVSGADGAKAGGGSVLKGLVSALTATDNRMPGPVRQGPSSSRGKVAGGGSGGKARDGTSPTKKSGGVVTEVIRASDKSKDVTAKITNPAGKSKDVTAKKKADGKSKDVTAKVAKAGEKSKDVTAKKKADGKSKGVTAKVTNAGDKSTVVTAKVTNAASKSKDVTPKTNAGGKGKDVTTKVTNADGKSKDVTAKKKADGKNTGVTAKENADGKSKTVTPDIMNADGKSKDVTAKVTNADGKSKDVTAKTNPGDKSAVVTAKVTNPDGKSKDMTPKTNAGDKSKDATAEKKPDGKSKGVTAKVTNAGDKSKNVTAKANAGGKGKDVTTKIPNAAEKGKDATLKANADGKSKDATAKVTNAAGKSKDVTTKVTMDDGKFVNVTAKVTNAGGKSKDVTAKQNAHGNSKSVTAKRNADGKSKDVTAKVTNAGGKIMNVTAKVNADGKVMDVTAKVNADGKIMNVTANKDANDKSKDVTAKVNADGKSKDVTAKVTNAGDKSAVVTAKVTNADRKSKDVTPKTNAGDKSKDVTAKKKADGKNTGVTAKENADGKSKDATAKRNADGKGKDTSMAAETDAVGKKEQSGGGAMNSVVTSNQKPKSAEKKRKAMDGAAREDTAVVKKAAKAVTAGGDTAASGHGGDSAMPLSAGAVTSAGGGLGHVPSAHGAARAPAIVAGKNGPDARGATTAKPSASAGGSGHNSVAMERAGASGGGTARDASDSTPNRAGNTSNKSGPPPEPAGRKVTIEAVIMAMVRSKMILLFPPGREDECPLRAFVPIRQLHWLGGRILQGRCVIGGWRKEPDAETPVMDTGATLPGLPADERAALVFKKDDKNRLRVNCCYNIEWGDVFGVGGDGTHHPARALWRQLTCSSKYRGPLGIGHTIPGEGAIGSWEACVERLREVGFADALVAHMEVLTRPAPGAVQRPAPVSYPRGGSVPVVTMEEAIIVLIRSGILLRMDKNALGRGTDTGARTCRIFPVARFLHFVLGEFLEGLATLEYIGPHGTVSLGDRSLDIPSVTDEYRDTIVCETLANRLRVNCVFNMAPGFGLQPEEQPLRGWLELVADKAGDPRKWKSATVEGDERRSWEDCIRNLRGAAGVTPRLKAELAKIQGGTATGVPRSPGASPNSAPALEISFERAVLMLLRADLVRLCESRYLPLMMVPAQLLHWIASALLRGDRTVVSQRWPSEEGPLSDLESPIPSVDNQSRERLRCVRAHGALRVNVRFVIAPVIELQEPDAVLELWKARVANKRKRGPGELLGVFGDDDMSAWTECTEMLRRCGAGERCWAELRKMEGDAEVPQPAESAVSGAAGTTADVSAQKIPAATVLDGVATGCDDATSKEGYTCPLCHETFPVGTAPGDHAKRCKDRLRKDEAPVAVPPARTEGLEGPGRQDGQVLTPSAAAAAAAAPTAPDSLPGDPADPSASLPPVIPPRRLPSGKKIYTCRYCQKTFYNPSKLGGHALPCKRDFLAERGAVATVCPRGDAPVPDVDKATARTGDTEDAKARAVPGHKRPATVLPKADDGGAAATTPPRPQRGEHQEQKAKTSPPVSRPEPAPAPAASKVGQVAAQPRKPSMAPATVGAGNGVGADTNDGARTPAPFRGEEAPALDAAGQGEGKAGDPRPVDPAQQVPSLPTQIPPRIPPRRLPSGRTIYTCRYCLKLFYKPSKLGGHIQMCPSAPPRPPVVLDREANTPEVAARTATASGVLPSVTFEEAVLCLARTGMITLHPLHEEQKGVFKTQFITKKFMFWLVERLLEGAFTVEEDDAPRGARDGDPLGDLNRNLPGFTIKERKRLQSVIAQGLARLRSRFDTAATLGLSGVDLEVWRSCIVSADYGDSRRFHTLFVKDIDVWESGLATLRASGFVTRYQDLVRAIGAEDGETLQDTADQVVGKRKRAAGNKASRDEPRAVMPRPGGDVPSITFEEAMLGLVRCGILVARPSDAPSDDGVPRSAFIPMASLRRLAQELLRDRFTVETWRPGLSDGCPLGDLSRPIPTVSTEFRGRLQCVEVDGEVRLRCWFSIDTTIGIRGSDYKEWLDCFMDPNHYHPRSHHDDSRDDLVWGRGLSVLIRSGLANKVLARVEAMRGLAPPNHDPEPATPAPRPFSGRIHSCRGCGDEVPHDRIAAHIASDCPKYHPAAAGFAESEADDNGSSESDDVPEVTFEEAVLCLARTGMITLHPLHEDQKGVLKTQFITQKFMLWLTKSLLKGAYSVSEPPTNIPFGGPIGDFKTPVRGFSVEQRSRLQSVLVQGLARLRCRFDTAATLGLSGADLEVWRSCSVSAEHGDARRFHSQFDKDMNAWESGLATLRASGFVTRYQDLVRAMKEPDGQTNAGTTGGPRGDYGRGDAGEAEEPRGGDGEEAEEEAGATETGDPTPTHRDGAGGTLVDAEVNGAGIHAETQATGAAGTHTPAPKVTFEEGILCLVRCGILRIASDGDPETRGSLVPVELMEWFLNAVLDGHYRVEPARDSESGGLLGNVAASINTVDRATRCRLVYEKVYNIMRVKCRFDEGHDLGLGQGHPVLGLWQRRVMNNDGTALRLYPRAIDDDMRVWEECVRALLSVGLAERCRHILAIMKARPPPRPVGARATLAIGDDDLSEIETESGRSDEEEAAAPDARSLGPAERKRVSRDPREAPSIHELAAEGLAERLDAIIDGGADVSARDKDGLLPIHHAASKGRVRTLDVLRLRGADIEDRDRHGRTALHHATIGGRVGAMEWLVTYGADVNSTSADGKTALHMAATSGEVFALRVLGLRGAVVETRDLDGWTPLHFASWYGHVACMTWLLDSGASANAAGAYGMTPLHWAARMGGVESVRCLLERGAKVDATDKDGRTAADRCRDEASLDVMRQHRERCLKRKRVDIPSSLAAKSCLRCETAPAAAVVAPCGHRCLCVACAEAGLGAKAVCPRCRAPVSTIVPKVIDD